MIAHVTAAAAIGRRLSLGEAWAATRGKRWRLIGPDLPARLSAARPLVAAYVGAWFAVVFAADGVGLVVIWGLLTVPPFICLLRVVLDPRLLPARPGADAGAASASSARSDAATG